MLDLNDIAIDLEAEVEGTWISFEKNTRVRVARYGNAEHEKYIQKLRAPYLTGRLTQRDIPLEASEMILNKGLAYSIVKDWEGLLVGGDELLFTAEKAFEIFQNPKYKTFRDQIVYEAQEIANFRELNIQDMEENLKQ